jgi:hypothetical protein
MLPCVLSPLQIFAWCFRGSNWHVWHTRASFWIIVPRLQGVNLEVLVII